MPADICCHDCILRDRGSYRSQGSSRPNRWPFLEKPERVEAIRKLFPRRSRKFTTLPLRRPGVLVEVRYNFLTCSLHVPGNENGRLVDGTELARVVVNVDQIIPHREPPIIGVGTIEVRSEGDNDVCGLQSVVGTGWHVFPVAPR